MRPMQVGGSGGSETPRTAAIGYNLQGRTTEPSVAQFGWVLLSHIAVRRPMKTLSFEFGMSHMKTMHLLIVVCLLLCGGGTASSQDETPIIFEQLAANASDLQDALDLNIFKFRLSIAKGASFRLVVRDVLAENGKNVIHFEQEFEVEGDTGVTLRLFFRRLDNKPGSALTSSDSTADLFVDCKTCNPSGMIATTRLPLREVVPTERSLYINPSRRFIRSTSPSIASLVVVGTKESRRNHLGFPYGEIAVELVRQ